MSTCRILIVEDEDIARDNLCHVMRRKNLEVHEAGNGKTALELLEKHDYALLITDMRLPDIDGMQLLEHVRQSRPGTEVIVVTGFASVETAVEAMKKGAYQYLAKPVRLEEVSILVDKALEKQRMGVELHALKEQLQNSATPRIVGQSQAALAMRQKIKQVAPADCTVLILGETGTGKELAARALHVESGRSSKRFLAVNCASLTEELLAHELFGHEKAAFTGANATKKGLLEAADGGTFFLDEIGDMSLGMQASMLRVLENRTLLRVGGTREIPVDVRIIAATNKDLRQMVEEGSFRKDLFYRLNVITVTLPPLRERPDDIPLLATFFLGRSAAAFDKQIAEIDDRALELLMKHSFPGNVRELGHIMERAVVLCNGTVITTDHLPPEVVEAAPSAPCHDAGRTCRDSIVSLEENERRYLAWVMEQSGGSTSRAAKLLGLNRGSLWRKLRRFNLHTD